MSLFVDMDNNIIVYYYHNEEKTEKNIIMSRKKSFKQIYLIFAGILAVIMIFCLIHVGSVLKEYEASQPENVAIEQFKKMQDAAKKGELKAMLEMGRDGMVDDEFVSKASEAILRAEGKLHSRLTENKQGGELLTYTVMAGDDRVADITLLSKGNGKTKLMLFTMSEWEVESMGPASYTYDMTLPASMTVLVNGETVIGTDTDGDGRASYYFADYFDEPEVIIRDSIGSELHYDGITKLNITEYTVQIPSNYIISSKDGSVVVPVSTAKTEAISDYKYVSQYTSMPENATYHLGIIGEDADFVITDNLGNPAAYTLNGHTVKLEGQASLSDIPTDVYSKDDVLDHARKWSLFMTADLGGAKYGFEQIEKFLLPDSYLMDVAHKWATGVDITFTSVHTLDNPPFSEESVSGYVKYSDTCFSADVKLRKTMHLNSGEDVTDTMNCRFYYIQKDGVWYVADIQEILA